MEISSGHETSPPEPIRHRSGLGHKQICSCGGKCLRYFFRTLSSPDSARQVGSSADWTNPKIKAEAKARVCSKGGEHVRHEVLVDQRPQSFGHPRAVVLISIVGLAPAFRAEFPCLLAVVTIALRAFGTNFRVREARPGRPASSTRAIDRRQPEMISRAFLHRTNLLMTCRDQPGIHARITLTACVRIDL